MSLQDAFDRMFEEWRRERAETQMTLGKLIKQLEEMTEDDCVANLVNPHSYRGYYSDIAFSVDGTTTAANLLKTCRLVMGREFTGYKGGEFLMGENTPVWISSYGVCGDKLIEIHQNGEILTRADT